jgi:hypothetical protein
MKYYIIRFYKEVPQITGMTSLIWFDSYGIFSITADAEALLLALDVSKEEITEDEALIGPKFYGISREFRKAYSAVEGLEPDEEGGSKTKVYHTDHTKVVTLSLMKKITKRRIVDEFNRREDQTGKESILTSIDAAATIWDLNILREDLLGVEMPVYQAQEMGLLNENGIRIVPVDYSKGF